MNDIDFGIYIEDVLTRIMYGEHVDDTFLPCGYVQKTIDLEKNIMHYINKNNLGQFDVKLKKITDYGDSNF